MFKNRVFLTNAFCWAILLLGLSVSGAGRGWAQGLRIDRLSQQAVYTVTHTGDSGPGSLRQAILDANANPGADIIAFTIGDPGSQQTIQPASALPVITDPVTVDGWSQGGDGYTGPPLIELNGALAGVQAVGLTITGGSSVVRGLVVNGFAIGGSAGGIRLQTGGGNWIYGNYIGVNFAGDTRVANQRGIWIDGGSSNNRIGTNADGVDDVAERNVISANVEQNIWLYQPATTGNKIMGNYIGLNAAGTAAVGTNNQTVAAAGILVQEASYTIIGTDGDGQGDSLEGNVISGSVLNINLTGTTNLNESHHNRISGNLIGTNASGTASVGIQVEGVRVYVAYDNLIGTDGDGVSDALEGNLISGNIDFGVMLQQTGARNTVVAGNKIGTDISGMVAIPNGTGGSPRAGIVLGGYGNRIGTNSDGVSDDLERNLISGNSQTTISAIYFNNQPKPDAPPTIIAGNWMGVDATGLANLPNNYGIGGMSYTPVIIRDNVISGHTYEGISTHSSGMLITGNYIGVGADGVTALGNGYSGIFISGNNNIIGGTGPGEGNIIAHNGATPYFSGVRVGNTGLSNTLRGNRIYANSQLGIDLRWPDGVNINDLGDPDTGGNNLQNYPIITFAQGYNNGTTHIQGTLNSNPNTDFILDFYYNIAADLTGYGEGQFYLGETSVATDGNGNAIFDVTFSSTLPDNVFVTATATHADGSTSEFSLAYSAGGVLDMPIEDLMIQVSLPVYEDLPAQFSASINSGTGVSYEWDFGDGQMGSGSAVEHIFSTTGTYTVILSASNNSSSASVETAVVVLEPANINGVVWLDRDADGFFGLGEAPILSAQNMIITVTRQGAPGAVLNPAILNGGYQVFTPQAGVYLVEATNTHTCATIPNCISTPTPVAVSMGEDGGTEINFGLLPGAFTPQPTDAGYIYGRAWIDSNGNGYPDPTETAINGRTVRLLDADGNQIATHISGSSWYYGSYAFRISAPGVYRVQMDAPGGVFPSSREVEVYVSDQRVVSAQLPFLKGGEVSGQISTSNGVGIEGVVVTLQPGNLQTVTFANGIYGFAGLPSGSYTLQITPPTNTITPDGVNERFVPVTINGSAVENWTLLKKGQLSIKAVQVVNGQALPINFMLFEVLLNGSSVAFVTTNPNGDALVEGLSPGTYIVRPYDELANILPGMQFTPAERTAILTYDSAATTSFTGTLARSLNLYCRLPGTPPPGFACIYEVRNSNGSLIETGKLPAEQPITSFWNFNPATLEVRLIPDPDVPGQESWPTHSQVVVLSDNTHVNVYYPYNPTNPQTISGYVYWDRCAPLGMRANGNNCTETNVPTNNGIPVVLYDSSGLEIASTLTDWGTFWNSGFFSFPDLPIGTYRVRANLPSGYAPTTGVQKWYELSGIGALEMLEVGYQLNENQSLGGRVFFDNDANGVYDPEWDDPIPGAAIIITNPTGDVIANLTSSSTGGYSKSPINSGEYHVTLNFGGSTWMQTTSLSVNGGSPLIDFALPPMDNKLRVIVFLDGNHNGLIDAGEQRLANVTVRLRDKQCGEIGAAELQVVASDAGGVATFEPVPAGPNPVCAQIVDGLPENTLSASNNTVNVSRGGGQPVGLAVQPTSTLVIRPFLDHNSNGVKESGEPYISGGSATIGNQGKSISGDGATFSLVPGSYPVNITPPTGYASLWPLPIGPVIFNSSPQTLLIPLRDAGSISGKIWPPSTSGFSLSGSSLAVGLTVQLQNTATLATIETSSDSFGIFSFSNLAPATYRLRLPSPPPGYLADNEPLITYQAGQVLSNYNLTLVPVGHISGVVYFDSNSNRQWDNNEQGVGDFDVRLISSAGQEVAVTTPDAAGYFVFNGLTANTPYALQMAAPSGLFITDSPGVFTVGADPRSVKIGISVESLLTGNTEQVGGRVQYQQGEALIPIAGARLIFYSYDLYGTCNVANPIIQYDQYTGLNGGYWMVGDGGCFKVVDVPGFNDTQGYYWGGCSGNNYGIGICQVLINGIITSFIDITLTPSTPLLHANAAGLVQASEATMKWSAFRDDNGNHWQDEGEPGLAGVTLAGGGSSGISGLTGMGQPLSLGHGLHTLTITPPVGYVVNGPATRQLAVQGADVTLPAIPLRPTGLTIVQAFIDLDGDGVQDEGEAGVGGVAVTLTGLAAHPATTAPNGRAMFAGLPDGSYTVSATPPAGFMAVEEQSISLAQGGVVQIPLRLMGMISGVLYHDWDGDGQQQPDEPVYLLPFTLTLDGGAGTTQGAGMGGGLGWFLGMPAGAYTLSTSLTAVQAQPISLANNEGQGVGMAIVAPGEVRGIAWWDSNNDGLRQPWESPLAGISVSLGVQSTTTDSFGRYIFTGIAPGEYMLVLNLPLGLQAAPQTVLVVEGRGLAVGLPVTMASIYHTYLPLINR